ncbi:hypothetical protein HWQ67_17650 [Candidatus Magnetobacterium casensis]|uniref:Uncharacterized protein n=1 Tax=Candidatus Magnetobacterium casense TaxID=1455061 RepID=A0ABS6S3H4_9BACT|nr:hypothetical protein [Candidatus Magnetobacterium casensis]
MRFDLFHPSRYLVPNHTEDTVKSQLELNLKSAWELGVSFDLAYEETAFSLCPGEKSIAWSINLGEEEVNPDGQGRGTGRKRVKIAQKIMKGTLSYKAIAQAMCERFFDLSQLEQLKKQA